MRYYKWTDRVKEILTQNKGAIIHITIAIGLTVGICAIMILGIAPSKSAYNEDMADIDSNITSIIQDIDGILGWPPAANLTQLQEIGDRVAGHAGDISSLRVWIANNEGKITWVEDYLTKLLSSPPEGYLTGVFGNYTLHARCNQAGNYTANINLIYDPAKPTGNATTYTDALHYFYTGINWTEPNVRNYVCELTYNSTAWLASRVWFNVGIFGMAANNETMVNIPFAGLNSTYIPSFIYAEVYPISKEG